MLLMTSQTDSQRLPWMQTQKNYLIVHAKTKTPNIREKKLFLGGNKTEQTKTTKPYNNWEERDGSFLELMCETYEKHVEKPHNRDEPKPLSFLVTF